MDENKKQELLKKANRILDLTSSQQDKYQKERNFIFRFVEKLDTNEKLEEIELILNILDRNLKLEKEHTEIVMKFDELVEQRIRKEDKKDFILGIFTIVNPIDNIEYSFFSRESAQKYIRDNNLGNDTDITIKENNNIDVTHIVETIIKL